MEKVTASKNENKPRIPAITNSNQPMPVRLTRIIKLLNTKPIRAAKIFGPALIRWIPKGKYLTMLFDEIPITLNFA